MPWQVTYHPDLEMVETRYAGELLPAELHAAVEQTLALGRTHHAHRYLGDCTTLQGGHSILDLYGLIELMASFNPEPFKEAVLLPQLSAAQQDVVFWETACLNRGFIVRIFAEQAPALAWLCDTVSS